MSKSSFLPCWKLIFFFAAQLSAQTPHFERLGTAEGLSQGMIYDLLQDQKGFLWFATKGGLNRYDGYSFQIFQNDPFNPFSIADNEIEAMLEDRLGRIWLGTTKNGLNVFDPKSGRFYQMNHLHSQHINCLAQTSDGAIWVGTEHGIQRVQPPEQLPANQSNIEALVRLDTLPYQSGTGDFLNTHARPDDLMGSKDGKLWISNNLQAGYLDLQTKQFKNVWTNPKNHQGPFTATFFKESPDGAMWIGQAGQLIRVAGGQSKIFRLPEASVYPYTQLAFDAGGNLYVGTRKQIYRLPAANVVSPDKARFELFYKFPEDGVMGSTKLMIDRGGLLWIGTNGYGLRKYNPGNRHFDHYLAGKSPRRMLADHFGRLWVWLAGSAFYPVVAGSASMEKPIYNNPELLQHDCIQTADGSIWLLCETRSTRENNGVLVRLNGQTLAPESQIPMPAAVGMFSRLFAGPDGKLWALGDQSNLISYEPSQARFDTYDFSTCTGFKELALSLILDAQGVIWIATPHGLVHATPAEEGLQFSLFKNNPKDPNSMNCNAILSMVNDPRHPEKLWLGTNGGGLNCLDKISKRFVHFTRSEGLSNNVVYAILPDENGALWLSTNNGLSRFDSDKKVFQNYYSVDGLQDNEFNTISYAQAPDGRMFFGGVNGITAFYPAQLNADAKAPPVLITQLKINNQVLKPGAGILDSSIEYTKSITLDHTQNLLTFDFAAFDFAAPGQNLFRYRLLGANQDWMEASPEHTATYAHLQPGQYTFQVMTGGSRGIWKNEIKELKIEILPPWWRTYWAYALYLVLFALGGWAWYRFQLNKIRLENKLAYEQKEALRLLELDRLKTNFFSSVTHEFRTPLTLLLEPARQLLEEAKSPQQRYRIELIGNSANRLLQFVNQLLDLSKLEAGQMPLDLRPGKLSKLLETVAAPFLDAARQRSIQLDIQTPAETALVQLDEKKWDQVLSNLLSNALKFTDKGGKVCLTLSETEPKESGKKHYQVTVSDTGLGISAEDLPRIFDRFYQAEHLRGGTGIGLSLCKELVEHMGGQITAESPAPGGTGALFRVQITCAVASEQAIEAPSSTYFVPHPVIAPAVAPVSQHQPLLLLVEDDTELRQFLRASLPAHYRIAEAIDGANGIQMAQELVPDLIISDLVMPNKDGYQLAETLKNDPGTSHIPIILLTAKSAAESRITGLQKGADVYLTKPFRADELVAQLESLLRSRQQAQAYFASTSAQHTILDGAVASFPPEENAFLQHLIQIVEENLDNEQMDADAYARAVFISRSQLHRKISALTGLSLTEFVRNHRLDRARQMLAQREGSISEIAWRTGFPNAKYFATCFKERFGVTPSAVSGK